ncbi:hypothetical protein [Clostridium botulinum]|uniref:hypothetical protein n=1 Tax=Clostridium botulinum TaxID=1491 RepID=UPI0002144003|nr:hypothetical protein [Clostridium botulinum]EGO89256.1 hypothetical protein CBCST_00070 [Clostridium botulinum C str. Stockholm]
MQNKMSVEDTLADVDAINIRAQYNSGKLKDSLLLYYKSNSAYGRRYSRFIDSLVKNKNRKAFIDKVRDEVDSVILILGRTEKYGFPSRDQKNPVTEAFVDVIFVRSAAE